MRSGRHERRLPNGEGQCSHPRRGSFTGAPASSAVMLSSSSGSAKALAAEARLSGAALSAPRITGPFVSRANAGLDSTLRKGGRLG